MDYSPGMQSSHCERNRENAFRQLRGAKTSRRITVSPFRGRFIEPPIRKKRGHQTQMAPIETESVSGENSRQIHNQRDRNRLHAVVAGTKMHEREFFPCGLFDHTIPFAPIGQGRNCDSFEIVESPLK
jgi:hypothetical protein